MQTNGNDPINICVDEFLLTDKMGGLTKRECFAAMAMQGILSNEHYTKSVQYILKSDKDSEHTDKTEEVIAIAAVKFANALIDELNK